MLMCTQRYLNRFLTPERTLRPLVKDKRRRGSLCKDSPKIYSKHSPKPTNLRPLALCSGPVFRNTTYCGPCFACNLYGCTPCNRCCSPSCCNCNPSCCACNPACYNCNAKYPLFQPCNACCRCSCVCESNMKCKPCIPPQRDPSLPLYKEEPVIAEKPSEVIFMNRGKVVHENRRFTAIGVDNK